MEGIKLTEMMGENVMPLFKFCGKDVKVYNQQSLNLYYF